MMGIIEKDFMVSMPMRAYKSIQRELKSLQQANKELSEKLWYTEQQFEVEKDKP